MNTSMAEETALLSHPYIRGLFLIVYVIVFVCCVVGNFMILIVIGKNRSMRTVTNFFLANLAVADLFVGIFCVFQNGAHFVLFGVGRWPFGRILCHSYVYVLHTIPNASAGILVLLSVERFIAVLRPMLVHHLLTKSVLLMSAVMVCFLFLGFLDFFLVWGFSALMNLPYLVAVQFLELEDPQSKEIHRICTRRFLMIGDVNVLRVVTIANLICWYVIPLGILLIIYLTIGFVLMRTTEEASIVRSSHQQSFEGRNRKVPHLEAMDSRRRVIRLVVVIVLCFALLSLPRYVYLTWSVFRTTNEPRCVECLSALVQPLTFLLLFVNSGINPILYAFLSQRFRAAIAETFVCSKNDSPTRRIRPPTTAIRSNGLQISDDIPLRPLDDRRRTESDSV